ncbi:MAG: hypothetical protein Q8P07_04660 [bacterium]|nr:hypothetical protein [bacterium]
MQMLQEPIDFNDYDKAGNGFDNEARLRRVHSSFMVINPEVQGACKERDNTFENFCQSLAKSKIRTGVINLAFDLAMQLGLINKFGNWQTKGDALAESKERVYPIWCLASAWVVDTIDATDQAVKATAKRFPKDYREFRSVMLERKVVLPAPAPVAKIKNKRTA